MNFGLSQSISAALFVTAPEPPSKKHYSRSPKVGNPIASILKSHAKGIPALIVLNPVSNFLGLTIQSHALPFAAQDPKNRHPESPS